MSANRIVSRLREAFDIKLLHITRPNAENLITRSHMVEQDSFVMQKIELPVFFTKEDTNTEKDKCQYQQDSQELEIYRLIDNELATNPYDLVICFYIAHFGHHCALLGKKYGIKTLVSVRGNDLGKAVFQSDKLSHLKLTLELSDGIVCVSSDLRDLAHDLLGESTKSIVIHNSLDTWCETPFEQNVEDKFVVASAGKFKFKKGVHHLLEAISLLDEPLHLKLIGDFDKSYEKEIFLKQVEFFGLKNRVEVTGFCNRGQVLKHINQCQIYVQPSLFSEGCPNTLLEAMSLSKPIIVTSAGAMGDIVKNQESGLVVRPGDIVGLSQKIAELRANPGLGEILGRGALKAITNYSTQNEYMAWKQFIEKLLQDVRG